MRATIQPSVAKLVLGLGWTGRAVFDLEIDAVAFLLGQNDKVIKDLDFVFYGNQCSVDGSIELLGSKLTEGYQEQICVDLAKVNNDHKKIVIALVIYQDKEKQQGFSQLSQVFVKMSL